MFPRIFIKANIWGRHLQRSVEAVLSQARSHAVKQTTSLQRQFQQIQETFRNSYNVESETVQSAHHQNAPHFSTAIFSTMPGHDIVSVSNCAAVSLRQLWLQYHRKNIASLLRCFETAALFFSIHITEVDLPPISFSSARLFLKTKVETLLADGCRPQFLAPPPDVGQ